MSPTTSRARRPTGKRGKRPVVHQPALRLHNFAAAPSPAPPTGDVTSKITDWLMLSNEKYGCCGPAATMHYRMAKAGRVIAECTDDYTTGLYFAYGIAQGEPGPQPDMGVDNSSWLKWMFDQGHIEGYAEIDAHNPDAVHRAMLNFSGVLIGVNLTPDAEEDFSMHLPWDISAADQPDPNDGHDILLVAYDQTGDTFVTWGGLQKATVRWDETAIDEAWVIVTAEDAARNGVDLLALQAQIRQLGGTENQATPVPLNPPVPPAFILTQPTPPPVETPPAVEPPPASAAAYPEPVPGETGEQGVIGKMVGFFRGLFK